MFAYATYDVGFFSVKKPLKFWNSTSIRRLWNRWISYDEKRRRKIVDENVKQ